MANEVAKIADDMKTFGSTKGALQKHKECTEAEWQTEM